MKSHENSGINSKIGLVGWAKFRLGIQNESTTSVVSFHIPLKSTLREFSLKWIQSFFSCVTGKQNLIHLSKHLPSNSHLEENLLDAEEMEMM